MLKAVIIEDEALARKRLSRMLESWKEELTVIGEAVNGQEGLALIEGLQPDVVFLDIEMPVMNGFEMLGRLTRCPRIVFTTAFEEYAIRAFEENAVDYLLKPVEQERLAKTIGRLTRGKEEAGISADKLRQLVDQLQPQKEFRSFPVKVGDRIILLKPEEIAYLEAREKYVFIVTLDGREYITDFSLAALEEKLPSIFQRVHRAFMINTGRIREIHKGFSNTFTITLSDTQGTRIHTGRSYHEQVRKLFEL